MKPFNHFLAIAAVCILGFSTDLFGQVEVTGWGGLRGIRVNGELMAFTTSIRATSPEWTQVYQSTRDRVSEPKYLHVGPLYTLSFYLSVPGVGSGARVGGSGVGGRVPIQEAFEDVSPDAVKVDVQGTGTDTPSGLYFFIELSAADYSGGTAELIEPSYSPSTSINAAQAALPTTQPSAQSFVLSGVAKGIKLTSSHRQLQITFPSAQDMVVHVDRTHAAPQIDLYFPLNQGLVAQGTAVHSTFTIKASGQVDNRAVKLALDPSHRGPSFDGIGGNFRIQGADDAAAVQYNLDNLRVAWGRVALPMNAWQPTEESDPVALAKAADSSADRVGVSMNSLPEAMKMAQTLARKNIPTVATVWFAPTWMLLPADAGLRGNRLNPEKYDAICKSIGSYLQYLKDNYGGEPQCFSFNEPDLGTDVRETPQEHTEIIERLGAYFASHGLKTKLLLGDTSESSTIDFAEYTANDPAAVKYIGAVSFHSWRGGTDEQYQRWGDLAKKLNVPLIVAEAGDDNQAYHYPAMFTEPWYALNEISTYVRILKYAQPASILEFQLTHNYSVLSGGTEGAPLAPTQRFWQLKQLNLIPAHASALSIECNKSDVYCCAYVDPTGKDYVVHMVNNGAARPISISGFPSDVSELHMYETNSGRGMKEMDKVAVVNGLAQFQLDSQTMTTLASTEP